MNLSKFKRIVAEYSGFDSTGEVSMSMTFADDLILESDMYYEMLETMEEEFDVDILSHDGDFESLTELANIIKRG
ncbi:MAG: hypothetical protein WBA54_12570 [Acidaminobacteraceae bacterium]